MKRYKKIQTGYKPVTYKSITMDFHKTWFFFKDSFVFVGTFKLGNKEHAIIDERRYMTRGRFIKIFKHNVDCYLINGLPDTEERKKVWLDYMANKEV